ncbi:MAG: hypothetical protein Q8907_00250 [Bacteroidota bacterium]|nr:hypothetical protein [Bacteroidota bacterium]
MSKDLKTEKKVKGILTNMPEQNRMQGDFLDNEFCLKFYQLAFPKELVDKVIRSYEVVINKRNIHVDLENPIGEKYICDRNFENDNIDVSFSFAIDFENIKEAWDIVSLKTIQNYNNLDTTYYTKILRVEIQPYVSDDYPNILRHMQKIKANCLYIREYTGKGLDKQKFIQIFNHQGISVVFERQLNEE